MVNRGEIYLSADIEVVVCDKSERLHKLLQNKDECPKLKYVVIMDEISDEDAQKAKDVGVTIIKFDDLEVRQALKFVKVNSLWYSNAIWHQGSRSTQVRVMACCLMAPSHYHFFFFFSLPEPMLTFNQSDPLAFITG